MNLRGNEQLIKNINDMISSAKKIEDLDSIQSYIDSILSDARVDLEASFNPETLDDDKDLRNFVSKLEHIRRDVIARKNGLHETNNLKEENEEVEEIEILDEEKEPTIELPKIREKEEIDPDKEPTIELPNLDAINSAKELAKELEGMYKSNVNYNSVDNSDALKEKREKISSEYNKLNEDAFNYNLYDNKEILDKLTELKGEINKIDNELSDLDSNSKQENITKDNSIELRNIKCIYKPALNVWQISAEAGLDSTYSKMYSANKTRFYSNADLNYDANMIKKYNLDNASKMDYSLCDALEQFDREMHTNILERYATNTFDGDVIYDLRELFKTPKNVLTRKEKFQIMKNAKNQKEGRNAEVYYFNTRKAQKAIGEKQTITPIEKAAIGTALGATVAAASLGSNNVKETVKAKEDITIENTENDIKSKFDNINIFEAKNNTTIDMPIVKNNIIDDINVEKLDGDSNEIRLGDKIYLDNVMLTYDSNGKSPRKNTDQLNFEYYKMCYIAIQKNGKVVEIFDRNKIDELKEKTLSDLRSELENKYGNIDIEINFNGYYDDENYIKNQGWVSADKIKLKQVERDKSMFR